MVKRKIIKLECIDDRETSLLTEGHVYYCVDGGVYYHPAPGYAWDSRSESGGMFKGRFRQVDEYETVAEPKEEKGEFILWSPDSTKAPKKRYYTYKQARFVARQMLDKHGGIWYVMRAECYYVATTTVKKREL